MPKQFIQLWCEYEYGQDNIIFESEETAKAWLWERIMHYGAPWVNDEIGFCTPQDIFDHGLAGFEVITLIPDKI